MSTLQDQLDMFGIDRTGDAPKDETLLNQTEARRLARALQTGGHVPDGLGAIAHPVPMQSWGGTEKGWSVSMMPLAGFS